MSKMNTYVNKDGYKIRATEKAHNLYYKKQGFKPVTDKVKPVVPEETGECAEEIASGEEESAGESASVEEEATDFDEYKSWSVASLKEALNEAGIEYPKGATKAELYQLLNAGKEE